MADGGEKKRRGGSKPIITYDFKHPRRVSKDQTRTLENLHCDLARMMASTLSSLHHSMVDVDIAYVDQTTYAEFIMSLSNPSCSYTFQIDPFGGPAVLDFAPSVAFSYIERRFGGAGTYSSDAKVGPLTAAERSVMTTLVTRVLADFEATWEGLIKVMVHDAELETNPEFIQMVAPSDTVMLIAFEVNSKHASGIVSLCYPYFTLEPVMSLLNVSTWMSREASAREPKAKGRDARLAQLDRVDTSIRAVLAQGEVLLKDLMSLGVGDVLVLDAGSDEPGVLFVGDRPKFEFTPTQIGNRHAARMSRRIVKAGMPRYMSEVQKTDTGIL